MMTRSLVMGRRGAWVLLMSIWVACSVPAAAQCPMCKMSAESNLNNGGRTGSGLNNGILYMLITPYLLVGTLGYLAWRNHKRRQEAEREEALADVLSSQGVSMSDQGPQAS